MSFEHVPDTCKIGLVGNKCLITFHLFFGEPLDNTAAKSGAPAIFREGKSCPFRSFSE
jgi:hypothetical protein